MTTATSTAAAAAAMLPAQLKVPARGAQPRSSATAATCWPGCRPATTARAACRCSTCQDGQNLFDPATSFQRPLGGGRNHGRAGRRRQARRSPSAFPTPGSGGSSNTAPSSTAGTAAAWATTTCASWPTPSSRWSTAASPPAPSPRRPAWSAPRWAASWPSTAWPARPDAFGLCAALSPSCWFARQAMNRHLTKVKKAPRPLLPRRRPRRRRPPPLDHHPGRRPDRRPEALHQRGRPGRHQAVQEGRRWPAATCSYVVDPRGEHNEHHWRRRLPIALRFLLRDLS